jgi:hypothetical protein
VRGGDAMQAGGGASEAEARCGGRRMGGTRQRKMDLRLKVIVSIFTVHGPNNRIGHQKMIVPLEIV